MGDRFIPTRSLMDLDRARSSLLEGRTKKPAERSSVLTPKEEYRRRLEENLTLDSEGRPFRMLPFWSPSTRNSRRSLLVDEMMQEERDHARYFRRVPSSADKILDGPSLIDDYYVNLLDWGKENILAVALGPSVYLWKADTGEVQLLLSVDEEEDHPTSVSWCDDGKKLAIGYATSQIELWDALTFQQVRTFEGHKRRVGSLSWNRHILTSGSRDCSIINHDVRSNRKPVSRFRGHSDEVCGLRWSEGGRQLASGGNDNLVCVWESLNMGSTKYLHRFNDHKAAVRALAWCPYKSNVLASGGGTADRCIKIWNTREGKCTTSIETSSQVCALEWNRHQKEILSAHGYNQNQLTLWSYPSMSRIADLKGHTSRVLHLSQSPDGTTVVSAAADESIRFWKVFEPPRNSSRAANDGSDSILSLKRNHTKNDRCRQFPEVGEQFCFVEYTNI
ncbi:cell division cycle 20.1, cofactor of APC complex-like [Ananas comosus]|uniref:Cell division cycle 20.1, cofactor of APC complex-like n=1 Tax=Ananas comosus TaxID=4615 RepID=A0A6P5EA16_ANACO|nr:cell division cycle 20.1, cofactor of APC complex-like [Ananas comosus]